MLFSLRVFLLLFTTLLAVNASAQTASPPPTNTETAAASPVAPRTSYNFVHVDGPYIAMTFDDGPSEKLTPKLLDLLAQHHIKATFFLIGQNAADYPDIV